ncbi:MAG TPA: hypothetical protein VGM77_11155 [Gemmatimonadales bacterium]|jgi:hypothetical protein
MLVQTLRMVATALSHPDYGVNARLALLERDGSDPLPPLITTVLDTTSSNLTAFGRVPQDKQKLPMLFVDIADQFDLTPSVFANYRQADIPIVIGYVVANVETAEAFRNSAYIMQSVMDCLEVFEKNGNAADRTRGNVSILCSSAMNWSKHLDNINDSFLTDALKVTYTVRALTQVDQ